MPKTPVNQLRSARKRAGLTQEELAHLVGGRGAKLVSRYERREREPMLRAALAFEIALGCPASELFSGLHAASLRTARRRAGVLALQLRRRTRARGLERKRKALERILGQASETLEVPEREA